VVNEHDKRKKAIKCSTKACDDIIFSVPVEIRTQTDIKEITLKCMGSHIIKKHDNPGNINKFEIVQEVSAQIPIDFITEVEIKDDRVDFDVRVCQ